MSYSSRLLPGFGLSLGITLTYLSAVVLIPLSMLVFSAASLSFSQFWAIVCSPRVLAAFRVTFFTAGVSALVNLFFGFLVAWIQVRYPYPGRKFVDMLIDLPFALPTAVAGITLTTAFSANGFLGTLLDRFLGIQVVYTPLGIAVALTFVGLPFVIRTLEPVLLELGTDLEEASATLGANRWQTFWSVVFPLAFPAAATGAALAFARALGEYGSIVFISGNMPFKTEIVPLLIITQLEQFDYASATAVAVAMLVASFLVLFGINLLQTWRRRRMGLR